MINKRGVVDFVESASPVCPRNALSTKRSSVHETLSPFVTAFPVQVHRIAVAQQLIAVEAVSAAECDVDRRKSQSSQPQGYSAVRVNLTRVGRIPA